MVGKAVLSFFEYGCKIIDYIQTKFFENTAIFTASDFFIFWV